MKLVVPPSFSRQLRVWYWLLRRVPLDDRLLQIINLWSVLEALRENLHGKEAAVFQNQIESMWTAELIGKRTPLFNNMLEILKNKHMQCDMLSRRRWTMILKEKKTFLLVSGNDYRLS